jgi:hypothetical protein
MVSGSMPTFVLHALGKPSRKIAIARGPVRVGRDPASQLVLGDDAVSRDHAVFNADARGNWTVACVSETNPIVVDGKLLSKSKPVHEGSEILVGRSHLIIFSLSERKAAGYLGEGASYRKSECPRCQWSGLARDLGRESACPDCGARGLRCETAYATDQEVGHAKDGATALLNPAQLDTMLQRIKTAKQSRLERVDAHEPARKELGEREPVEIARGDHAALRLFGLTFGGSVRVAWTGARFVATSTVVFPGMKINGVRTKSAPLAPDDVIEIGSNRFRFVTEEGAIAALIR